MLRPVHAVDLEFGIRVSPGASRSRIVGLYGDRLKIQVQAPPERGRANLAVRQLLAAAFGVTVAAVEIIAGETAADKRVRIRGARPEDRDRLGLERKSR